jgi:stearoyl-CoA desaturase (Delta-9 desaturase)
VSRAASRDVGGAVPEGPSPRSAPPIRQAIAWSTVAGLGVIHGLGAVGLIVVVRHPSVATLVLAGVLYVLSGLSITAGYHRLFAHRTYRASAPVRWFFLAFGAAAFQNSALAWSADHRAHHADTDGPDDPHAITNGVWWAHAGWLLRRRTASADVARLGDLWAIRSVRLQRRFYPAIAIALGLGLPTAIASTWGDPWGGVLVAGFLRSAVLLQATCCVNSLAHTLGRRTYDKQTSARDNTITSLITFGEGYHSFHHRFPFDYRNGVSRWAYDPSKWLIWSLARVHLVNKTRTASQHNIARAVAGAPSSTAYRGRSLAFSLSDGPGITASRRVQPRRLSRDGMYPRTTARAPKCGCRVNPSEAAAVVLSPGPNSISRPPARPCPSWSCSSCRPQQGLVHGLLPHRPPGREPGPGHGRRLLAPVRPRSTRGGLPLGARPAHASAGHDDRCPQHGPGRWPRHAQPGRACPRHMQRGTGVFFDNSTQPASGHP